MRYGRTQTDVVLTAHLLADFARVDSASIARLDNVQLGAISFVTTLDRLGVKLLNAEPAPHVDPAKTSEVTDQDFICGDLKGMKLGEKLA